MIKITANVVAGLISHAKDKAPIEACGYLAGKDDVIILQYRMKNMDASEAHFSLDPKEQFDVVKDMRKRGFSLAGVYHSHPLSPARPSQEDLKLANDPDLSYVIVSLNGEAETVKSFRTKEDRAENEEIEIVDQVK